jgi:hypothetical protein
MWLKQYTKQIAGKYEEFGEWRALPIGLRMTPTMKDSGKPGPLPARLRKGEAGADSGQVRGFWEDLASPLRARRLPRRICKCDGFGGEPFL